VTIPLHDLAECRIGKLSVGMMIRAELWSMFHVKHLPRLPPWLSTLWLARRLTGTRVPGE